MKRGTLDQVNADRAENRPVALVTETAFGAQWLVYGDAVSPGADLSQDPSADLSQDPGADLSQDPGAGLPQDMVTQARAALADDRSATCDVDGKSYFIQVHNPPLRLYIVGAVHITQALARMASIAGYAVTVIDPRRAFAEPERFPGIAVSSGWPDDVLAAAKPDRRTAIVTLSHDPKIDDPALETVLRSDVFYIGSLGSKRTHGKRLARLDEKGFSVAETGRIHGPVGLDIGAKSPAEIAISIMAEITQARRATRASAPVKSRGAA